MKAKAIEVVRGSGNVFADFGHPNAAAEQLKALLAGQIINVLDRDGRPVRPPPSAVALFGKAFAG